jgi:hypothetical protein
MRIAHHIGFAPMLLPTLNKGSSGRTVRQFIEKHIFECFVVHLVLVFRMWIVLRASIYVGGGNGAMGCNPHSNRRNPFVSLKCPWRYFTSVLRMNCSSRLRFEVGSG